MGLSIKGYVLEPPRVGAANSAFTATPNDLISDQTAWDAAYPPNAEPNPRVDYLVFALTDGLLVNATFCWTKNEVVQRFDYASQDQRFKTWGGAAPATVGTLQSDANTNRLKVYAPLQSLSTAPFRVSVGAFPGQTFSATLVTTFTSGGAPVSGTVEILLSTNADDNGKLNWHAADIATGSPYLGQTVRFQRQQFYSPKESTGSIGTLSIDGVTQNDLMLDPLPGTGQYPLLRIGYGLYLTPVEVLTFTPGGPAAGVVEWMRDTGELRFSAPDIASNQGKPVYYDGAVFGFGLQLPRHDIGAMPSTFTALIVPGLPVAGGDVIFRLPSVDVQFPITTRIAETQAFDSMGKTGEVALRPLPFPGADGEAQFSAADRALYWGTPVQVVYGDLPIERGISLRLFRCSANLSGSDMTIKDVTAFYSVGDAVLADPIVGAPQVFLPAVPVDGTITVKVEQGTGTYTDTNFRRLDVLPEPTAPLTLGYTLDFDGRQLFYAQHKTAPGDGSQDISLLTPAGAAQLPDVLLNPTGLTLSLNEGSGWSNLTLGQDALVDLQSGVVSFTRSYGQELVSSTTGALTTNQFTDAGADLSHVSVNDLLVILGGAMKGVYSITASDGVTLTIDGSTLTPLANLSYEIHCGVTRTIGSHMTYAEEVLADRFWAETLPSDPDTKVERIVSLGVAQNSTPLTIPTPLRKDKNVVFSPGVTVVTVPDDSKFTLVASLPVNTVEVSLTTGNLNLLQADVVSPRFRFGGSTFSTSVVLVPDDAHLGTPTDKQVQISLATGNLRFSTSNLGSTVYWVRMMWRKVDYRLTPELGFLDFTSRFLQREEALITYRPITDSGPGDLISERGTFIIRKEICGDRTSTTNVVTFNPDKHSVASTPAPQVFRGGRPQDDTQVKISLRDNTVQFLPDRGYMTDALPHGSLVRQEERIYIDYYVYDAVGGEKTITVLQPPMATARVIIQEEATEFTVAGDQTTTYPAGSLLRIEQDEVYILGTATYDAPTNITTIPLAYGQKFANAYQDPKLYLPSGATRLPSMFFTRSYFVTETAAFDTVPRGMNKVYVAGDLTTTYKAGVVLLMGDATMTFLDSYLISGAKYDSKAGKTEITLTMNARRQYTPGTHVLRRSIRPIIEQDATVVQTSTTPILTQPYTLFRRIEGQPGRVLTSPTDYTIDDSGRVVLTSSLLPTEEVTMFYTGYRTVPAGAALRASYTSSIVPTQQNGLANQILKMDYTLFAPDTFYFRVETLSNFQAEVSQQMQKDAQGSTPSGGPMTSNSSQPKLYEQGRESNFFAEGHYANTDIVLRAMLKYYNDAINHLEDVLQNIDGRVVGDADGRLKFDGLLNTTVRSSWSSVTNQIDDIVKVSDYPIGLAPPFPFTITWIGTYQKVYLPGRWSRFFPMFRASVFAYTSAGSESGDVVADFKWTNFTSTDPVAFRRWPRAVLTKDAKAGDTTLYVDNATGATDPVIRPPFENGMKVVVASPTTPYVTDAAPLTVASVSSTPERLGVSALPVDIPAGATVYLCTTGASKDTTYPTPNYRIGTDVALNYGEGKLVYVKAYFPFDGSIPLIPSELCIKEIGADQCIQINNVSCNNALLEPFRFPALDGKTIMDCGDQAIPMINPSPEQELFKLPHTTDAIAAIQGDTTATSLLSGSLTVATQITAAALPGPTVQPYDLVRFITGPNSGASIGYRRVTSVVGLTITVDSAFPNTHATQEQFMVTAAVDVATGTFTMFDAMTMQLPGAIPSGIHVGHTVVITNGNRAGTRRQVTGLDTVNNRIGLHASITLPVTSTTFRVSNHLSTYSNLGALSVLSPDLFNIIRDNDHNVIPTVIDSEVKAIDRLFDGDLVAGTQGVFTDILPGGSSSGSCPAGDTLEDNTLDFTSLGIAATHYVFIRNQPNQGIYPVSAVQDSHHVKINGTFPTSPASVTYRIVSVFGLSKPAVQNIMCVLSKAETFLGDLTAFDALLNTTYPVKVTPGFVDPSIYATGLLSTDLTNWDANITTRQTFLTTSALSLISGVLSASDKLYDQRFVWIDGRINRKKGITAKQLSAMADRVVKVTEQQNDLTKLVTLQKLQTPTPPSQAEADYNPTC